MKFTTPCFMHKNTPELRKKLEEMGYKAEDTLDGYDWDIFTVNISPFDNGIIGGIELWYIEEYPTIYGNCIDCGTNEALFLALAALKEDSDEGQWFVFTELLFTDCHVFHSGDIIHYDEVEKMFTAFEQPMYVRKATPAELIEHFKNNNQ